MSSKITIQNLAEAIASRRKISVSQAEQFVKAFFELISQQVLDEKTVKIKGLGTFKLIEVLDRESVNVNSGERFLIPGHSKVSFTPDAALRDQVNKPFADFQTVILNDATDIEEMERTDSFPLTESTSVAADEETETSVPEPQEDKEAQVLPLAEAPVVEAPESQQPPIAPAVADEKAERAGRSPWPTLCYALLTLLLMGLSYYAGYHRWCPLHLNKKDKAQTEVQTPAPKEEKTLSPADSLALVRKQILEKAEKYKQIPGASHLIIGERRVHTMRPGEGLYRIAASEYGDKEFAQYIIIFNEFANPNVITVGSEVKIPELIENPLTEKQQ